MALMRRTRSDADWNDWIEGRLDWPFRMWADLRDVMMDGEGIRLEEFQEDGQYVVRADIPGIDPDTDIEITTADGMLQIKAERRQEEKTETRRGYRSEVRYGSFLRRLPLPSGATDKDVKASYEGGVLEIRVPVGAGTAAKRIPIAHP